MTEGPEAWERGQPWALPPTGLVTLGESLNHSKPLREKAMMPSVQAHGEDLWNEPLK